MKKYKVLLMAFALGLSVTSCEQFTDGINVDPNEFTSAPGNLLIGQAELVAVVVAGSNNSRYAGMWVDQFTGSDRQYITADQYGVTAGDFDDVWDDLYADGAQQAILAKEEGQKAGDQLLEGVASIIEAMLIGEAAAIWGDVPYRSAFDYGNNPDPTYDPQAQVFEDVQALLDDAIALVGDASVGPVYGAPVFVSNNAKWGEVAHTLKARFYLITKQYDMALAEAQMGISDPSASLLSSHKDASGARNLYYQFEVEQRGGYLTANGSNLTQLLDGTRARLLATPGDSDRLAHYFVDRGSGLYDLNVSATGYFGVAQSYPIVDWIETKLIEAEAAAMTSGDGLTPLNEVRDHLAATYGGSFPHSTATGDDLIAHILEEKYCSLPGSTQIWHDTRRTKNLLGVPIKNSTATTIPQRFLYPQVEINANDNFPGLVDLFEPTPVNK